MELQTGLVTPKFEELNSDIYRNIIKQLENQRSTINLLHLQLKKQSNNDKDKAIQEKDKIIIALEKQLNTVSDGDSNPAQELRIRELEAEVVDLEQRLMDKNKENRSIQQKYNEHLNQLNNQLTELEKHKLEVDESSQQHVSESKISELNSELESKIYENNQLTEQVRIMRSELEQTSSNDDTLMQEIQTLRNQLNDFSSAEKTKASSDNLTRPAADVIDAQVLHKLIDFHSRLLDANEDTYDLAWIQETQIQYEQLLTDFEIKIFDSVGENIDETHHHIVEFVYSKDHAHNVVFREVRKGFKHFDQIFQKASVIATRNPVHCRSCGFISVEQSKFCSQCGARLEMETTTGLDPEVKPLNDFENAKSYLELAQSHLKRREYERAEQALNKSRSLNPACVVSVVEHAKVLESRGDFETAREMIAEFTDQFGNSTKIDQCIERLEQKSRILSLLRELH